MARAKAQALISDLHERFGDEVISPQQKELMAQLQAHIHDLGDADPVEPNFIDALEVFVTDIEAEHPNVAAVVTQILETLKNIGV